MSQESESPKVVLDALERTTARKTARIELRFMLAFELDAPKSRSSPQPAGKLIRRLVHELGRRVLRLLLWGVTRLFRRWTRQLTAQRAVGVVDFEAHRCTYGYPSQSEVMLVVEDRLWQGTPGTALASLSSKPAPASQPLWLVDLLHGVEQAHPQGVDVLDGHACRRYLAHANLNRATDAVSYDMAVPAGIDQLSDLTRIPVEVWIDDEGCIRRVSERHGKDDPMRGASTFSLSELGTQLSLSELGTQPPSDWSRLQSL